MHSTLLENGGHLEPLRAALDSVVAWCSGCRVWSSKMPTLLCREISTRLCAPSDASTSCDDDDAFVEDV